MTALQVERVTRDFAGVHALREVSLTVRRGEVVAVVGPNGSGKTTLVNVATGTLRPTSGTVWVDGHDLTGKSAVAFADHGALRTFQGVRLFEGQTVLDNVLVGGQRGTRTSLVAALSRSRSFRRRERELAAAGRAALDDVGLRSLADQPVVALSHGQRRRVELARAFAAQPAYLVLDEPGAGLDPAQVTVLADAIGRRRDRGVGILLVEHDLDLVARVATRVVGLAAGTLVAEGDVASVSVHPALAPHLRRDP